MSQKIKTLSTEDQVVCLLIREWFENIDAIRTLYKECKVMPAFSIVRTSYEVFTQLVYLLYEEDKVSGKAAAFCVYAQHKKITRISNLIKGHEKQGMEVKKLLKQLSIEKREMNGINCAEASVFKEKIKEGCGKNKKYWSGWTEVYDNHKKSLKQLSNDIKFNDQETLENWYELLYDFLSSQAHGYNAAYGIFPNNEGSSFLKSFGNPMHGTIGLGCIRIMSAEILKIVCTYYKGLISYSDITTQEKVEKLIENEEKIRKLEHEIAVF